MRQYVTAATVLLAAPNVLARPVVEVDQYEANAQATLALNLDDDITEGTKIALNVRLDHAENVCGSSNIRINGKKLERDQNGIGRGIVSHPGTPQVNAAWTFECLKSSNVPVAQAINLAVKQVNGKETDEAWTIVFRQTHPPTIIDIRDGHDRSKPTASDGLSSQHEEGPLRQKVLFAEGPGWQTGRQAYESGVPKIMQDHPSKLDPLKGHFDEVDERLKAKQDAPAKLLSQEHGAFVSDGDCEDLQCQRVKSATKTQQLAHDVLNDDGHGSGDLILDEESPSVSQDGQRTQHSQKAPSQQEQILGSMERRPKKPSNAPASSSSWLRQLHLFRPQQRGSDVPLLINVALGLFVLSYLCLLFTRHIKRRASRPLQPEPEQRTQSGGDLAPHNFDSQLTESAEGAGQNGGILRGLVRGWRSRSTGGESQRLIASDADRHEEAEAETTTTTTTVEEEIAQLRQVATLIGGMVTAGEGRSRPAVPSQPNIPPQHHNPSISHEDENDDDDSLPPYDDTDDESGNPSLVADGFRYVPGSTSSASAPPDTTDHLGFSKR